MQIRLSASVSCANPLYYRETIPQLDQAGLNAYHFDMCDGHFAPTFLLYPDLVKYLRPLTARRFDVHLYCTHPSRYLDELAACGADVVIVHLEAEEDYREVVRRIRLTQVLKAGLAILPGTPVPENIQEILPDLALVVINTVGPAYAGQPFDPRGLENLARLSRIVRENDLPLELVVDGNVCVERLKEMLGAGCTHLVCGSSSIFKPDTKPAEALVDFRRQVESHSQNVRLGF